VVTNFRRTEQVLRKGKDALSFALDVGEISTPRGTLPIHELELERIAGRPEFAYEVALELSNSLHLHPVQLSKAERGFAHMRGEQPVPQRGAQPAHAGDVDLDSAIAEIFALSLQQLMANEAPARQGVDSEGVHQLRVATRRMLASLALFHIVLPKSQRTHFKRELRWLIRETGDARDLDVFVGETLPAASARLAEIPAHDALVAASEEYRAEAYVRVRAALESRRYSSLLLELGSWISRRGWREQPATPARALLFAPAREVADTLLAKRHRKVKRAGRDLKRRSPKERHRLRLQVKKLRYASDSLGSLYGRKAPRRFRRSLAALQDVLGGLNDRATADRIFDELLERIGLEAAAPVQRLAAVVRSRVARQDEERVDRLMEEWRRFRRCEPFWESGKV
jgi:CHAD domain-containing protein